MTNGDPPNTAQDLRDWFRELKTASGLSYAEIASAIGEEDRNVKRWMTRDGDPVIPRGDVVLKLLSTLGVTFNPPAPGSVRSLNAHVGEIRSLLTTVDEFLAAARATEGQDEETGGQPGFVLPVLLAIASTLEDLTVAQEDMLARVEALEKRGAAVRRRASGEQ